MRVLVTGGRSYEKRLNVFWALAGLDVDTIIHGGATGADTLASEYAKAVGIKEEKVEAPWGHLGRGAGKMRNSYMLQHHRPDLVLAFPGHDGTADCVRKARAMDIPVLEVRE